MIELQLHVHIIPAVDSNNTLTVKIRIHNNIMLQIDY